jgi:hypothetical protein
MYLVIKFRPNPGRIDVVEHGNATLQAIEGGGGVKLRVSARLTAFSVFYSCLHDCRWQTKDGP